MIIQRLLTTEKAETEFVCREIASLIEEKGVDPKKIAILCRTNKRVQQFLKGLEALDGIDSRYNIPSKSRNPKEYLKARALYSLLGTWASRQRSFGSTEDIELAGFLSETLLKNSGLTNDQIHDVVGKMDFPTTPALSLYEMFKPLKNGRIDQRLSSLRAICETGSYAVNLLPRSLELIGVLGNTELMNISTFKHELHRIQYQFKDLNKGHNLQTMITWLNNVKLASAVNGSTAHRSKGQEWHTVFLTGCVEGQWPHYYAVKSGSQDALDDEFRLFYVAATRAEECLYLTSYMKNNYGKAVRESEYLLKLRHLGIDSVGK